MASIFLPRETWTEIVATSSRGIVRHRNTGGTPYKFIISASEPAADATEDYLVKSGEHREVSGATRAWARPLNFADGLVEVSETGQQFQEDNLDITDAINAAVAASIGSAIAAARASQLAADYPIGSLYLDTNATMPAHIAALGTWAAYGAGRAIVGVGTADSLSWTGGQEQGAKSVTLGMTNIPEHSHDATGLTFTGTAVPDHSHATNATRNTNNTFGGGGAVVNALAASGAGNNSGTTDPSGGHTPAGTIGGNTANAGQSSPTAVNVVQPSIGTYIWKRTA